MIRDALSVSYKRKKKRKFWRKTKNVRGTLKKNLLLN